MKPGRQFLVLSGVAVCLFVLFGHTWTWWFGREMSRIQGIGTVEGVRVAPVSDVTVSVGQPPRTVRSLTWSNPFSGSAYIAETDPSTGKLISIYNIADGGPVSLLFWFSHYLALISLVFGVKHVALKLRYRIGGK